MHEQEDGRSWRPFTLILVAKGGIEPPTQGFSASRAEWHPLSNQALATHAMRQKQRIAGVDTEIQGGKVTR